MATDTSANIGIRVFLDDAASRGLYAVNTQLGQAGTLARRAGLGFGEMSTAMAGLAVVAGLAASFAFFAGTIGLAVKEAISFQTLQIQMARAIQGTNAQLTALGPLLMSIGGHSIFSLQQLAQGFIVLGQHAVDAKSILNGVGQEMTYLAEATGTLPVDAALALSAAMITFQLSADKATYATDLLQYAFEHGIPNMKQLASAISTVGPIAANLHEPLDEIVVLLDQLSISGMGASQAGTTLRYMLQQLAHPATTKAADEFKKFGISLYDSNGRARDIVSVIQELAVKMKGLTDQQRLDALSTMFTVRGGKGALTLVNEIDQVIAKMNALRQSHDNAGNAMAKAKAQEDSAAGAWNAFKTNMQDVLTLMGGPFLALIQPVIIHLRDLAGKLREFAGANPQVMAAFAVAGAAVSAFGLILAIAMSPVGLFIGIMLGVVAAVAAVAAAIVWLRANWTTVIAVMNNVWQVTQRVVVILLTLGGILLGLKVAQLASSFVAAIPSMIQFAATLFTQVIPAMLAYLNQLAMTVVRAAIAAQFNLATIIPSLLASAAAWWANAIAEMAALAPYILLIALVAGAVVGLVLLIQHLGGLNALLKIGQAIWQAILPALQEAGAAIKGAFLEAVKQLQPVWNQLVQAFNQAKPFLMWLGIALGVIIAVAIAVFIGAIRAAINVITALITAIIGIVAGIIKVFAGIVQFFMGFFTVLHGIFTGNFSEIQAGFKQMGQGLVNIVTGLWDAIKALFVGAFNVIKGFITGFISGVIGFFQNLANNLVHHSIIPDMLNAIVSAILGFIPRAIGGFTQFIGQMISNAQSLPGKILSAVGNLGNLLFNAGKNIVQGLINGFMSVVQNLYNAISNALANVRNMFPHSPAKIGPLTDLHTWMPNVVKMLVDTTDRSAPTLHASMARVAGTVKTGLSSALGGSTGGSAGGETYNLQIDGRTFMSFFHSSMTGELSANGVGRMQR